MVNERECVCGCGSSICWVRDTEKIIKSNKIKKPKRKTYVISFGIVILKGSVISVNRTSFYTCNYNTKK